MEKLKHRERVDTEQVAEYRGVEMKGRGDRIEWKRWKEEYR